MFQPSAKVICDSVNLSSDRLTTMVLTYHRMIHSEFMTHSMLKRKVKSWELPRKDGYTFVSTSNIRKASKTLTHDSFYRKAKIWYSVYFDDFDIKHFQTISKLRRFLKSNPKGIKRIEKTLTDCEHDTTLLILNNKTLKSTKWARN